MQLEIPTIDFPESLIMASKEPETEGRLSAIETDLKWHRGIGWGVVGIYAVIFGGFLTWYLPKELASLRESINSDTAKQLSPINERLAAITAILDLRGPDAAKKIGEVLKQNLAQPQAPELGLKTITAITKRATDEKINA